MSKNHQHKKNGYIGTKTAKKQPKNRPKPPKNRQIGGLAVFQILIIHN